MLAAPGLVTGICVGALNAVNIKKSPEYDPPIGFTGLLRFGTLVTVKGLIYGTFYPISLVNIIFDTYSERMFNRHFIPFSRYRMTDKQI